MKNIINIITLSALAALSAYGENEVIANQPETETQNIHAIGNDSELSACLEFIEQNASEKLQANVSHTIESRLNLAQTADSISVFEYDTQNVLFVYESNVLAMN